MRVGGMLGEGLSSAVSNLHHLEHPHQFRRRTGISASIPVCARIRRCIGGQHRQSFLQAMKPKLFSTLKFALFPSVHSRLASGAKLHLGLCSCHMSTSHDPTTLPHFLLNWHHIRLLFEACGGLLVALVFDYNSF